MKRQFVILLASIAPALAMAHSAHPPVPNDHATHAAGVTQPKASPTVQTIGHPGESGQVNRTIQIDMLDLMRFQPDIIQVQAGETIRFQLKNTGQIDHEIVLGSLSALRQHAEEMRAQPDMAHDEPNAVSLAPNQGGELVWTFGQAGIVDFACLLPGHSEAGMIGKVQVL